MNKLVIIDLETGGLDATKHPITQIGAIAVDARSLVECDRFHRLVKFREETADPDALRLNHYDPERWAREGVDPRTVAKELCAFLDKHATVAQVSKKGNAFKTCRLAGHNAAGFDVPFLRTWIQRLDDASGTRTFFPGSYHVIDTLILAAWHFDCRDRRDDEPNPADLKLGTLAAFIGCDTSGAHDALADCELVRSLLQFFAEGNR